MPRATVIIPTHNPRMDLLRRVLAALAVQTLPPEEFEILLVDNASTPPLSLPDESRVTVLPEPRPGLRFARECGILAAHGEVIFFVDDDNELASDYLVRGLALLAAESRIGAAGGRIIPEFEAHPAPWVAPHHDLLALRDLGAEPVVSRWRDGERSQYPWCAPLGAGMIVRTCCARAYLDAVRGSADAAVGRRGQELGGAEDNELILCGVLQQGFEVAYDPALRLTHLIAARRLTHRHLRRLLYQTTRSWARFRVRHGFATPIPAWTLPLRALRAAVVQHAWTPAGCLRWRRACGEFAGRAGAFPPPRPSP